jgi:hypothetical protein
MVDDPLDALGEGFRLTSQDWLAAFVIEASQLQTLSAQL